MKKLLLAIALAAVVCSASFAQNYISGIVGLHGDNTLSGTTTVASGASLYFNNNKLYAQRSFVNRGDSTAIIADSGTLVLSGRGAQAITGRFRISALQIDNPRSNAGIVNNISPTMVTILDSVTFGNINNSSFDAGDGLMTLRSNEDKTARIADLTNNDVNTGNAVNGEVIAERYIRSRRAWRLLGPPTTADSANDQTIKDAWQEGATAARGQIVNPNPGYGTVITRPGYDPPAATGYDDGVAGSSAYSLHMYTSTGLYTQPVNTDFTHFSAHAAYLLFVRGDRSVSPETQTGTNQTPSTITTLRSKGALHNGGVVDTVTQTDGGYAGVANPYACTVDFSKAILNNVYNGFYVWDPTLATVGAWVYIDGTDNYNATPSGVGAYTNSATNSLIQSGQAILVTNAGSSGTITFKESNKNITSQLNAFREVPLPSIIVNLYNADTTNLFLDGTVVNFDASFSKDAVPGEDITKPANITESLSFYASGKYLIKQKWMLPAAGDTLPVRLWKTSAKKYRFVAQAVNMPTAPQAYLMDKYLKTSVAILANTKYDFSITNDAASKAIDRFAVVFNGGILPVTLTQIKANLQDNGVNVQWDVQNESGIAYYEIEKAADGTSFTRIGTIAAQSNGATHFAYHFFDAQPYAGDNYYRVKSVASDGSFTYTSVVKVTVTGGIMTVIVYPNPVKDGVIKLLFKNAPASSYNLTLYGSDGKIIMTETISHPGGTATYKLPAATLAQGLYQVEITGGADNKVKRDLPVAIE